ncbi:glycosyl transferase [Bradyrhizobium sp.]|uniref:glycosyl transferase n=1 Tax=Bradyrhizobium sp. TaxID=376 RepID=UPI003C4D9259
MNALNANPEALTLFVIVAAALICVVLIRLLLPLLRLYALARPNARSSHREPTPQGAGIAVIAASLSTAGAAAIAAGLDVPAMLLSATLLIALVGLVDDVRPIAVLPRLLLQAASVGAVTFLLPRDLRIAPELPLAIERGLILLAGLWFVNLVNFMDGLDLMTAAEVVPIAGAIALLGLIGPFSAFATVLAAALFGAMIGFAPFNRPIAKVFLGDVGSLPIGLLLGWCLLQLACHQQLIAALLLPLYYLADATITLLRRMLKRQPFWAAHRTHFYQRATDNGFSVPDVVGRVFALNVVLAALAIASTFTNSTPLRVLALAGGIAAVGFVLSRFSQGRSS